MDYTKYENTIPFPKRDDPDFTAKYQVYAAEEGRLANAFAEDFFEELGIQNNPKKDLLFSKAWDRGHSGGYAEVMNAGYGLVDLIL